MQVKVFEAQNMASGLKKVKESLGPDALILSTRTVRRGKFGVIGKPIMEITAAVDSVWEDKHPKSLPLDQQKVLSSPVQGEQEITYDQLWSQDKQAQGDKYLARNEQPNDKNDNLQTEVAELRQIIQGLSNRISNQKDPDPTQLNPITAPSPAPTRMSVPDDPVVNYLENHGVDSDTARIVARFTRDSIDNEALLDTGALHQIIKRSIARLIKTESVLDQPVTSQKRISLIGPTGVGKTTTIAKIAANYIGRFGGKVALITIDTYRIAAIEQLKVYGEIMRLPVEVVIKPDDLDRALDKYQDYDLILIDTAGRSPKNEFDLHEMASFLRPQLGIDNHLLLSATTRERELKETIHRFSVLPISNIIFSKVDECDQLGVILNMHYHNHTPISFLTNGQRVPEDIISPTSTIIADLIINDHRILTNG